MLKNKETSSFEHLYSITLFYVQIPRYLNCQGWTWRVRRLSSFDDEDCAFQDRLIGNTNPLDSIADNILGDEDVGDIVLNPNGNVIFFGLGEYSIPLTFVA